MQVKEPTLKFHSNIAKSYVGYNMGEWEDLIHLKLHYAVKHGLHCNLFSFKTDPSSRKTVGFNLFPLKHSGDAVESNYCRFNEFIKEHGKA